jgi:drug/metabolite transporter (DMT)-like permease
VSAYIIDILGVIGVSFASVLFKMSSASPAVAAGYRLSLAALMQLPLLWWHRKELTGGKLRLKPMIWAGIFLALHFFTWVSSFQFTSVQSSVVLVTTQPLFIVLYDSIRTHTRVTRNQGLGLLLAFTGSCIIGLGDLRGALFAWQGDLLALAGAACAAAYFLCGREVQKGVSTPTYSTLVYAEAGVLLLITGVLQGNRLAPYPVKDWVLFLILAFVCTVGGHSLLNLAMRTLPAAAVSMTILGEPVGGTLWAFLLLGQPIDMVKTLGGAAILAGIVVFNLRARGRNVVEVAT